MSGLELPAFVVGVAGLFSSSVDAFSYFKAAQNAEEDVDTVLLKLDVEKARLILWANEIGMFSVNQQHPRLLDEAVVDLISRILKKVITKLTDSEQLRASYGVVNLDGPRAKAVDYLSSNGFEIFRWSSHRFWTRYASKLRPHRPPGEGSALAKTKWAIYEKEKFQALVNDVKDFVDNLYEFIPVDKETQMHVLKADIESILDLSHLKLVEAATEDSYRAYSEIAGSVIEASEKGTIDRRTVEEYIRDAENLEEKTASFLTRNSSVHEDLENLRLELQSCSAHIVLTGPCHKLNTLIPCDVQQLGEQSGRWVRTKRDKNSMNWGVTFDHETDYALWNLLKKIMNVKSTVKQALEDDPIDMMRECVKTEFLDGHRLDAFEAFLPLVTVLIYCSTCACHIHTALDISVRLASKFVGVSIRPDDRIVSSCCQDVDRVEGLRSILDYVGQVEGDQTMPTAILLYYLDRQWVEQRLDSFDYERPYKHREARTSNIIIIGEADHLHSLLSKAPGRIPRPGEIWTISPSSSSGISFRRDFRCRFNERKHKIGEDTLKTSSPDQPLKQSAAATNSNGAKRVSSPVSVVNKRRRLSHTSQDGDSSESARDQ